VGSGFSRILCTDVQSNRKRAAHAWQRWGRSLPSSEETPCAQQRRQVANHRVEHEPEDQPRETKRDGQRASQRQDEDGNLHTRIIGTERPEM
jgi:hypothetical protein